MHARVTALREHCAKHRITLIAEVKPKSPFGWESPIPAMEQLRLCENVGDVVSIHTSEWWGGSWQWLELARKLTAKPILAKGFHPCAADVRRAFDCGADYVLTVGWWNGDSRCWHECETLQELASTFAPTAVWNSRNPRTGQHRPERIAQAVRVRDTPFRHQSGLCQASGIRQPLDIEPGVQAVLIGEGLYA